MNTSFEDQIRERAYQIWLSGADGQAHDHWVCAEQAVLGKTGAEASDPVVIITKAEPKAAKPRKAAAKPAASKAVAAKPATKLAKASKAKAKAAEH